MTDAPSGRFIKWEKSVAPICFTDKSGRIFKEFENDSLDGMEKQNRHAVGV